MREHWTARADRDGADDVLGEDQFGDLWVPSRRRPGWWDRRLDLRRPSHWPFYVRSRRRRSLALVVDVVVVVEEVTT